MIEVKGLCKSYGDSGKDAVRNIDIHVEKGTIHGLIGHNGSGKTTIIKCLTGIFSPDAGTVKVDGEDVYDNVKIKQKIGYVADSNQLLSGYKISKLADMYREMFPEFSMVDFISLNKIFRINLNKKITQLSKGQQMRVSFMLNMARNPKVMILDEPTSGLDAMAKKDLLDTLVSAVENNNMTVVISSHHLGQLEKICDSITMIRNGVVQIEDDLDEVKKQITKYQVVFPEGAPGELYHMDDIIHMSNVGSVYTVVLPNTSQDFEETMRGLGAVLVEAMPVGLEESFVYMNKISEKNQRGGINNE
jgi:ABC-2 type transport system ATP-binding protein